METNPSVTLTDDPQWLHPVQLGPSTLLRLAESPETLAAVEAVLRRLAPDPYIEFMLRYYALGRERFGGAWGYADQITLLHAAARLLRPRRYMEIGVFRGRSLAVVASAAPDCELYAFDMWVENYAGLDNVGPELVRSQLQAVGHRGPVQFVSGSSHETVPAFFAQHPELSFDMLTVDGDHTEDGARRDLETVLPRLQVGGVLVFDDICHPKHPWLERVWAEVVGAHPGFRSAIYTEVGHGVAVGIRRDADTPVLANLHGDATARLRSLAEALEEQRRSRDEQIEAIEADRAERLRIIERQGHELGELAAERNELRNKLHEREAYVRHIEEDRDKRLRIIEHQGHELAELAAERNELRNKLHEREAYVRHIEEDRDKRLRIIERQGHELAELAAERNDVRQRLDERQSCLVQQAAQLDQARAIADTALWDLLTPRKARRLKELLDRMAEQLAAAPEASGA